MVCCDEKGLTSFQLLRHRRNEPQAFLYAFDLLELDGQDLRREPLEVRKATLASILRKARHGVRLNEHLQHDCGLTVFQHACKMGLEGIVSKRLGSLYRSGRTSDWLEIQEPGGTGGEAGGGGGLELTGQRLRRLSARVASRTCRERRAGDRAGQHRRWGRGRGDTAVIRREIGEGGNGGASIIGPEKIQPHLSEINAASEGCTKDNRKEVCGQRGVQVKGRCNLTGRPHKTVRNVVAPNSELLPSKS